MKEIRQCRRTARKQLGWFAKVWLVVICAASLVNAVQGADLLTNTVSLHTVVYFLFTLVAAVGGIRMFNLRADGVWVHIAATAVCIALERFAGVELKALEFRGIPLNSSSFAVMIVDSVISILVYLASRKIYRAFESVRRELLEEKRGKQPVRACSSASVSVPPKPSYTPPANSPTPTAASAFGSAPSRDLLMKRADAAFRVYWSGEPDASELPVLTPYAGDLLWGTLHVGQVVVCSEAPFRRCRINALSDYDNHQVSTLREGDDYVMLLETDGADIPKECCFLSGVTSYL